MQCLAGRPMRSASAGRYRSGERAAHCQAGLLRREAGVGREAPHPVVLPGGSADAQPGGCRGPGARHPVVLPGGSAGALPAACSREAGAGRRHSKYNFINILLSIFLYIVASGFRWSCREAVRLPSREAVGGREARHPVVLPGGSAGAPPGGGV